MSEKRLVCVLDHFECDKRCPSCKGDYAVWREATKRRKGSEQEEDARPQS